MEKRNGYSVGVIISAYSGFLFCPFSDMHAYIEQVLGCPVFTHQMGNDKFSDDLRIKMKANGDFDWVYKQIN